MQTILDEILEVYENKQSNSNGHLSINFDTEPFEATHELCEYLFGDGDIQHLYNYYNILDESRGIEW
jgi:hypothetical protein